MTKAYKRFNRIITSYPEFLLFILAFLYQLILITIFPVVNGSDTMARLLHRDWIFLVHWLPATQSVVYVVTQFFDSLSVVRVVFSVFHSFLIVGFYRFIRQFYSPEFALFGALFFACMPIISNLGTIPYQESLNLLFIVLSFNYFRSGKSFLSILLFGLACLTRYESWFLCPFWVYVIFFDQNNKLNFNRFFQKTGILLGYSWGVLFWLFLNQLVYDDPFHFTKRYMFADNITSGNYVYLKTLINQFIGLFKVGGLHIIFGFIGIYHRGRSLMNKSVGLRVLILWVLLLAIVIPVFVPGHPGGSRFISTLLIVLSVFIPAGLQKVFQPSFIPVSLRKIFNLLNLEKSIYYLVLSYTILHSGYYWHRTSNNTFNKQCMQVTRFIDNHVTESKRAVLISKGFENFPNVNSFYYVRTVGHSSCGKPCVFDALTLSFTNESELRKFINSENILYFIVNGSYDPHDEQEKICLEYIKSKNLSVVKDFGHTTIYQAD